MTRFPFDGVDPTRGPTASQAAGLTMAAARAIIAAVVGEARAIQVAMSCAVVDAGGQLVAFERMDGADLVTITLAQDKAWTALVNRMPTGDLAALAQPGAEFYGYDSVAGGRTIIFDGGLPLECDGVLVGGVGVSGGDTAQDAKAAASGVSAFERGPSGTGQGTPGSGS
ncbi:MAG TPA: heme-binding protein [Candidatus Saccharimonadia bacterium]|nr:heme-binding protein [Candidatus Saccharimonadia bacterium]